MTDPFATVAIRERVLSGWTAAPVRFREDANTEEDFALGGYRDRVLVELAQNAADAASRAGRPGRLRLVLRTDPGPAVLVAANTGAPLTAEGVGSLATLRASAKRDAAEPAVGRFGVGFAAVLAVTDEPMLLTRTGGVRFSRDDTAELVGQAARTAPDLGAEVRRRAGHVPVLRLPFEAEGEPPEGFDSAVVLPLRDQPAVDLVRRLLDEVDDALLLALPALDRVEFDVDGTERVLADVERRWLVHRAGGAWSRAEQEELLADRPTEDRTRPTWSVLWAIPRQEGPQAPGGRVPPDAASAMLGAEGGSLGPGGAADPAEPDVTRVLHAPTPTDELLSLPALLIASFPLDPTRRHVAPGPLTDRMVELAAEHYAQAVGEHALAGGPVAPLVPVGIPAGPLDGALRAAVLDVLPRTPILRPVEDSPEDPERLLRPRAAVVVDDATPDLLRVLAPAVDGLVPSGPRAAYDALGVRRIPLADLVEDLATIGSAHPPDWWRRLYAALAESARDPRRREALGGLPVPLADGRLVRGPRGLVLLQTSDSAALALRSALTILAPYGLRVVHTEAVHETLERLGAVRAGPRELLDEGAVRTAVAGSDEAEDPGELAGAVFALVESAVAAGELRPGDLPWLGRLTLPDEDGEPTSADALVLPGSEAEAVLDPEAFARVDPDLLDRWGPEVLETTGVIGTLGTVTAAEVDLRDPPDELADLHDLEAWVEEVGGRDAMAGELTAIRDLDYVEDGSWPRALRLIAAEPALRAALIEPVQLLGADGRSRQVMSYPAWWIRRHVRLDGVPIGAMSAPDAGPALAAVLPPAPAWLAGLDPVARSAFGLARRADTLDAGGVRQLLARLADEAVPIDASALLVLWAELGTLDGAAMPVEPPDQARVLDGTGSKVVDADEAVVADAPMWLQRADLGGFVVAGERPATRLADLLDVPMASECAAGAVAAGGEPSEVPPVVRLVLPEAPEQWWEHEELRVDGHEVDWWVDTDGRAHAATVEGLARALAWATRRWSRRFAAEAVLAEPDRAGDLLADLPYDSP